MEPGCYFIDAVLVPAMERPNTSKFFNHKEISRFRGFGGVRIESDVVLFLLNLHDSFDLGVIFTIVSGVGLLPTEIATCQLLFFATFFCSYL